MKTYHIKTFGCQMNQSDSERISAFLAKNELKKATDMKSADLVIFNTCGVRQMAEDRVYGQIHNLRTWEEEQGTKNLRIALTGCLANRKDVQRRLKDKVDLFFPINEFPKQLKELICCHPELACLVNGRVSGSQNKKISLKQFDSNNSYLSITPKYNSNHTALVPIMTGCNNFCAYCVVPYARGREVSRSGEEILKEISALIKKGYKEIVLLGQNVNSYNFKPCQPLGTTLALRRREVGGEVVNFPKLLKKINALPGKFWISFVSNHPKDITPEFIEVVTKLKKVCELVHLPLQAGNDLILKKMNRKYTSREYLNLINKIKKSFRENKPGKIFAITSDIIVGFPGETKKQFIDSAEIMKKAKYDMVYFGQYSPRPGTTAYGMKDNVSKKEKNRRENYLNDILKETTSWNNQKYLGEEMEILVDKKKNGSYFGHTRTGKNVRIISDQNNLVGKIIKAKISKANIWNLETHLP